MPKKSMHSHLSSFQCYSWCKLNSVIMAKFHYTGPTGPARTRTDPHGLCWTQRSFSETQAAKKSVLVRAGPVGSVRVRAGPVGPV